MSSGSCREGDGYDRPVNVPRLSTNANNVDADVSLGRADLTVDEARKRILQGIRPLNAVDVSLAKALGRILAGDVVASFDVPPFANAAMDGYALVADTSRSTYRIVGEVAAGHPATEAIEPDTAVQIMTGAPVPAGADAVVRFEETGVAPDDPGTLVVHRQVRPGQNIRLAGEDIRAGARALESGTRLLPASIGVLASLGLDRVPVHRAPRVAILATGDEVVATGTPLAPGQVYDANSALLVALVQQAGGEPVPLGAVGDDAAAIRERLVAAGDADLILTAGGVSVGDYDLVKDVLAAVGTIAFWSVRIRPGRPLAFGHIQGRPLIGLPGNPVAAAVAFVQFARPLILTMLGRIDTELATVSARLHDRIENRDGRRQFVRVRLGHDASGYTASLAGAQGSGMLSTLAHADGLLVVPEDCPVAEPDMMFAVQVFEGATVVQHRGKGSP